MLDKRHNWATVLCYNYAKTPIKQWPITQIVKIFHLSLRVFALLNIMKLHAWNLNTHLPTFLTAPLKSTSNIELCWVTTSYPPCLQVKWPLSRFRWQCNAVKAECDLCRSLSCISSNRAWPLIMSEWQWLILTVLTKCCDTTWVFAEANNNLAILTKVLSSENRW